MARLGKETSDGLESSNPKFVLLFVALTDWRFDVPRASIISGVSSVGLGGVHDQFKIAL